MRMIYASEAKSVASENKDSGMDFVMFELMKHIKRNMEVGNFEAMVERLPWYKVEESHCDKLRSLGYIVETSASSIFIFWGSK